MSGSRDIQLICLDLDGTAADHAGPHTWLADHVVDVLNEVGQRGVRWCVNSGRSFQNQIGMIQACRPLVNMPVALLSGERFIHWTGERSLSHEPFNTLMRTRLEKMYPQVTAALGPHLERLRATYQFNYEQDTDLIIGWNLNTRPHTETFITELRTLLAGVPDAQILQNATWVIVTHREAGKGVVLAEAARHLGIAREQILAIGDHLNDLDMLDGRAAAHVGCPADSDPEVKAIVRRAGGMIASAEHTRGTVEIIRRMTNDE